MRGSFLALLIWLSIASCAHAQWNGCALGFCSQNIIQAAQAILATLPIGAGGYLSGLDIENDGVNPTIRLARTDTYGFYVLDGTATNWQQGLTSTTMPAASVTVDDAAGVYEAVASPSNTNTIYIEYLGQIFVSVNRGLTFSLTAFPTCAANDANDGVRGYGTKIAVDPHNPSIVFAGCSSGGMFKTTNGGASWSAVSGIANAAAQGFIIAYDKNSTVTSGVTQTLYISSYGTGVYKSTDGGNTFALTSGGPTTHAHMIVGTNHTLFEADGSTAAVNEYNGTSWSAVTVSNPPWTFAQDPANANNVLAIMASGDIEYSANGGASFGGPTYNLFMSATDIPWLASVYAGSQPQYIFADTGNAAFDLPAGGNKLFTTGGVGIWTTNPTSAENAINYVSQSAAIEQLVGRYVLWPPGGPALLGADDRSFWYVGNPNAYPSKYGPAGNQNIVPGYSLDYSGASPSFVVGLSNSSVEQSSYSNDGGNNWTPFPAFPPFVANGKIGGCMATDSAKNVLWVPSDNGTPYTSGNIGAAWSILNLAGVPTSGYTGYGFADYLNRQVCASDKVAATTFYLYNDGQGTGNTGGGVWKGVNGTWTRVYSSALDSFSGFNFQMKTSPTQSGVLLASSGPQTCSPSPSCHPVSESFWSSLNGGASWSAVANVKEIRNFAYGAAKPGSSYPTVYIEGWVSGVYGFWYSTDNLATWTNITTWPNGTIDSATFMGADNSLFGHFILAEKGSGYTQGTLPGAAIAPTSNSPSVAVAGTGATITWNTNETATSRINYGTTTAYGTSVTNGVQVTSHSLSPTGLSNYTLYHYQIYGVDTAGVSFTSYDLNFTSANTIAPSAPSSVTATPASNVEIDLAWTGNQGSDPQTIAQYNVTEVGVGVIASPTSASYKFVNGAPGTQYCFTITAQDASGNVSPASAQQCGTTSPGASFVQTAAPAIQNIGYSSSSATYSAVPIGPASSTREVFCADGHSGGINTTAMTIGGVSATQISSSGVSLWEAAVAAGTSATVVVSYDGAANIVGLICGYSSNLTSSTPNSVATPLSPNYYKDPQEAGAITVPSQGFFLEALSGGGNGPAVWSNGANSLNSAQIGGGAGIVVSLAWGFTAGSQQPQVAGFSYAGSSMVGATWH